MSITPASPPKSVRSVRSSTLFTRFRPSTTYPTFLPSSHPALSSPPALPSLPSVYIISPAEDGSIATCAFDSAAPPSPVTPDLALLADTPPDPTVAHAPVFRRKGMKQMEREGVVLPRRRETEPALEERPAPRRPERSYTDPPPMEIPAVPPLPPLPSSPTRKLASRASLFFGTRTKRISIIDDEPDKEHVYVPPQRERPLPFALPPDPRRRTYSEKKPRRFISPPPPMPAPLLTRRRSLDEAHLFITAPPVEQVMSDKRPPVPQAEKTRISREESLELRRSESRMPETELETEPKQVQGQVTITSNPKPKPNRVSHKVSTSKPLPPLPFPTSPPLPPPRPSSSSLVFSEPPPLVRGPTLRSRRSLFFHPSTAHRSPPPPRPISPPFVLVARETDEYEVVDLPCAGEDEADVEEQKQRPDLRKLKRPKSLYGLPSRKRASQYEVPLSSPASVVTFGETAEPHLPNKRPLSMRIRTLSLGFGLRSAGSGGPPGPLPPSPSSPSFAPPLPMEPSASSSPSSIASTSSTSSSSTTTTTPSVTPDLATPSDTPSSSPPTAAISISIDEPRPKPVQHSVTPRLPPLRPLTGLGFDVGSFS